jgi:hypothetical protein
LRLRARCCRLGSQVGAEQLEVRYLGILLREARGSPGERGPQGSQRAPDTDLAANERRLGGAPIRQILGEGDGASRRTPRSQKGKGMPETVTWRILGTSLQRTSSDDRSDPTVASARSRSSSQDWSSCSSSRTKTGSEASRVRNRSNWGLGAPPHSDEAAARLDGLRVHARLFRDTGCRRVSHPDAGSNRPLSDGDGGDFGGGRRQHGRHDKRAWDHVSASRLPYHDGRLGRRARLGSLLPRGRRRPSPLR